MSALLQAEYIGGYYLARVPGEKPLAFLRAFIDDSASELGDQRLYMAGYVNRADKWKLFGDVWNEERKAFPSIDYLKMAEAQNLGGQFRGWKPEDRDAKLRGLARVIRHFKPFSFEFSLSREIYYRIVRPVSPRGLGNPHFVGCFGVVAGLARYLDSEGIKAPVEFIFDEQQGVDADIRLFFDQMKLSLPKDARRLIEGLPKFRNDREYVQLQAVDMLAWHLRREHEEFGEQGRLPMANLLRSETHLTQALPKEIMQNWADHHSQIPGIDLVKTKAQWRNFKKEIARLTALGIDPATIGQPPLIRRAWNRIASWAKRLLSRKPLS